MIALGFDSGSKKSAFALLESRGGGGAPLTITVLQKGMVASASQALTHLLDDVLCDAPDVFCIETIAGGLYQPTKNRGGAHAVARHLLQTAKVEQMFRDLCRSRGETVDITASQWRKSVCGRGNATKHLIRVRIPQVVFGLKSSNEHTRDAVGCAVAIIWSKGGRV